METVVQKYGGSSLADIDCLRRVAQQVVATRRGGANVVVVVSAMGKTTDGLIAQARAVASEPSRRELDMLVTAGERISMALMSMAIHEAGEQAISFTGSQSGIITEDTHQGARIIEVRPERIVAELDRGRIVIVAGYQGVSRRREVTTLGRGGSDTSAVALAAALGASACDIYSDVDGVYSADPRLCPQARLLPQLRYETMQAMAGAGAKVLNAEAVQFAERAGITIHARKTGDNSGRQTTVHAAAVEERDVAAVVGAGPTSLVQGRLSPSALADVLGQLAETGGRVVAACTTSAVPDSSAPAAKSETVQILIDRTDLPERDPRPLERVAAQAALRCSDVGVVSIVGGGVAARPAIYAACLRALAGATIVPRAWLSADSCLRLLVPPDVAAATVQCLHAALLN